MERVIGRQMWRENKVRQTGRLKEAQRQKRFICLYITVSPLTDHVKSSPCFIDKAHFSAFTFKYRDYYRSRTIDVFVDFIYM